MWARFEVHWVVVWPTRLFFPFPSKSGLFSPPSSLLEIYPLDFQATQELSLDDVDSLSFCKVCRPAFFSSVLTLVLDDPIRIR